MQNKSFSSTSLMLLLMILSLPVILLWNYSFAFSSSFLMNLLALAITFVIIMLFFVPTLIIKSKTGLDFQTFALRATPSAIIFTTTIYAAYFIYIIEYFLLNYIEVFSTAVNPNAHRLVVAGLMLLAALYASCKGVQGITRSSVFVIAFAIIAFILFYCGNLDSFKFSPDSFKFILGYSGLMTGVSSAMVLSFIAVVFASICGESKNCRLKHIVFTVAGIVLLCALSMFFVWFVLGRYADKQQCQMFLLSKSAHFGMTNGIDSFFLCIITLSVFMVLAVSLICIVRTCSGGKTKAVSSLFAVIAFVLFVSADYFAPVRRILQSPYILNIFTFITALLIPTVYIVLFRRRLND